MSLSFPCTSHNVINKNFSPHNRFCRKKNKDKGKVSFFYGGRSIKVGGEVGGKKHVHISSSWNGIVLPCAVFRCEGWGKRFFYLLPSAFFFTWPALGAVLKFNPSLNLNPTWFNLILIFDYFIRIHPTVTMKQFLHQLPLKSRRMHRSSQRSPPSARWCWSMKQNTTQSTNWKTNWSRSNTSHAVEVKMTEMNVKASIS